MKTINCEQCEGDVEITGLSDISGPAPVVMPCPHCGYPSYVDESTRIEILTEVLMSMAESIESISQAVFNR